jgi:hypothetical protein
MLGQFKVPSAAENKSLLKNRVDISIKIALGAPAPQIPLAKL